MNGSGLSHNLYDDMINPHVYMAKYTKRGLGWVILEGLPNGEYGLNHGGSNNGIKTQCFLLPKSKRGLVVLTNGDNGYNLINIIKESFEEGEIIVNAMYGLTPHKVITIGMDVLERYTGIWIDNIGEKGRKHTIIAEDGLLKFSGEGVPSVTLYPESENKFFLKDFDVQFEFTSEDSFKLISGGKIDWTAKKIKK
jgi:hypothetical protein